MLKEGGEMWPGNRKLAKLKGGVVGTACLPEGAQYSTSVVRLSFVLSVSALFFS